MKSKIFAHAILVTLVLAFNSATFAGQTDITAEVQQMQVDINSADAEALAAALDGVGVAKAREIVAHREMYGTFQSIEQLTDVTGIGAATVEKNRHRIIIVLN